MGKALAHPFPHWCGQICNIVPVSYTHLYVIEPSLGCDRVALAFLCEAYDEEVIDEAKNDVRVVLHLHPALAPFKAAILPLSKKLSEPARKLHDELSKYWMIDFDETGSIGKRYRRCLLYTSRCV